MARLENKEVVAPLPKVRFRVPGVDLPDRNRTNVFIVELFVVLAIVTVLMGMVFPVYRAAMGAGRGTVCADQLRRMGQMFLMYAQDYDGYFPPLPRAEDIERATYPVIRPEMAWTTMLGAYREPEEKRDPFICPAAEDNTYAYNAALGARVFPRYDPNGGPLSQAGVQRPSETFLAYDTANRIYGANNLSGYRFFYGSPRQPPFRPGDFVLPVAGVRERWMRPRHQDGNNVLYCDGHVRRISDPAIRLKEPSPFDPAAS